MECAKKHCKVCGRLFKPVFPTQSVCGMKCYNLAKAGIILVNAEKIRVKTEKKKCAYCGKEFDARPMQRYCCDRCADRDYQENRKKRLALTSTRYIDKPESERTKTCPICGKKFVATTPMKVYCSSACRDKHSKTKKAQYDYNKGVALEKPYVKHKPKHDSHIEDINATAKAHGMTYGKWQAQKRLALLHQQMERC